jgi:phosphoribosyl 1,2-cyclic phosphate phosphodiesterase
MRDRGWIEVRELRDGETVELAGVEIRPFRLEQDFVYGFELREGERRALIVMDELKGWRPPPELRGVDLAVLPMGICEHDPFTGERRIHEDHPILRFESTLEETLAVVDALGAERVVLSHVEEIDGLSHDDLDRLAKRLDRGIVFAWDGLVVEV